MADFKNFLSDFSHLISGATSVAGGVRSEIEENVHSMFNTLMSQSGFVSRDEFNALQDRFDQLSDQLVHLEKKIDQDQENIPASVKDNG